MTLIDTEEQILLRDMLRRYFTDRREAADHARNSDAVPAREDWTALAELGLPGLLLDEDWGGSGCGPAELAIAAAEMGRALLPLPYAECAVMAAGLVQASAPSDIRDRVLVDIASGAVLPAFVDGRGGKLILSESHMLSGHVHEVAGGMLANRFVVAVCDQAGQEMLWLVDAGSPGVKRSGLPRVAAGAGLKFGDVGARLLDQGEAVRFALEKAEDLTALCRLADTVGTMDEMLLLTVEHLSTRQQFGRALATFQVLQHRLAEMFTELEMARSMLLDLVAHSLPGADPVRRRHAVAAAKLRIASALDLIGPEAIQMHGGMGMAWEHRVGHLVRRATATGLRLGGESEGLDHLAAAPAFLTA